MQIGFLILGALVVDDVGDVVDVDTAGGHFGGDQDVDLVAAEGPEGLLAGALAQVAVDGPGSETAVNQFLGQFGGGALGLGEDDGAAAAAGLQDPGHNLGFVEVVCTVDDLADVLFGDALIFRVSRADVGGLCHVATCHRYHRAGHGG